MDTSLPPSLVRRVVRAKLRALQPPAAAPGAAPPRDVPVARDALAALGDAAAIFVHFLADGAQAHARAAKRATMTADDVLKALADAEFADFEQGMAGVVAGERRVGGWREGSVWWRERA